MTVNALAQLKGGLIVSSQASEGEPLCAREHICALALSGLNGGACGLRLEGGENIAYVRERTSVPIIGLTKCNDVAPENRLTSVYITPTFEDALFIAESGADIIALDATERKRPGGLLLKDLIARIHQELGKTVWADISTYEEGIRAAALGADVVSTTLFGYTQNTEAPESAGPDFDLLARLCKDLNKPVVLEGRVWEPSELNRAFMLGAYAVVVGSAVTRPQLITKRFVKAIPSDKS